MTMRLRYPSVRHQLGLFRMSMKLHTQTKWLFYFILTTSYDLRLYMARKVRVQSVGKADGVDTIYNIHEPTTTVKVAAVSSNSRRLWK